MNWTWHGGLSEGGCDRAANGSRRPSSIRKSDPGGRGNRRRESDAVTNTNRCRRTTLPIEMAASHALRRLMNNACTTQAAAWHDLQLPIPCMCVLRLSYSCLHVSVHDKGSSRSMIQPFALPPSSPGDSSSDQVFAAFRCGVVRDWPGSLCIFFVLVVFFTSQTFQMPWSAACTLFLYIKKNYRLSHVNCTSWLFKLFCEDYTHKKNVFRGEPKFRLCPCICWEESKLWRGYNLQRTSYRWYWTLNFIL